MSPTTPPAQETRDTDTCPQKRHHRSHTRSARGPLVNPGTHAGAAPGQGRPPGRPCHTQGTGPCPQSGSRKHFRPAPPTTGTHEGPKAGQARPLGPHARSGSALRLRTETRQKGSRQRDRGPARGPLPGTRGTGAGRSPAPHGDSETNSAAASDGQDERGRTRDRAGKGVPSLPRHARRVPAGRGSGLGSCGALVDRPGQPHARLGPRSAATASPPHKPARQSSDSQATRHSSGATGPAGLTTAGFPELCTAHSGDGPLPRQLPPQLRKPRARSKSGRQMEPDDRRERQRDRSGWQAGRPVDRKSETVSREALPEAENAAPLPQPHTHGAQNASLPRPRQSQKTTHGAWVFGDASRKQGGREGGRKNTQGLGRGSLQTHGEAKCIGSSGIHAETDRGGGGGGGGMGKRDRW